MELLATGLTRELRQLVTDAMQDCETDVTLFHTLESLVQIVLPQLQGIPDGAVLKTMLSVTPNIKRNNYYSFNTQQTQLSSILTTFRLDLGSQGQTKEYYIFFIFLLFVIFS